MTTNKETLYNLAQEKYKNEKILYNLAQEKYNTEALYFSGGVVFNAPSKEVAGQLNNKLSRKFTTELYTKYLYVFGTTYQIAKELSK